MKKAHETARKYLGTPQERMKRDYDVRTYIWVYVVGDPICILDTATVKGQCNKQIRLWKSPGFIMHKFTLYPVPDETQKCIS